jgi:hypothetical protein
MEVNTNLSTIGLSGSLAARGPAATPAQTRSARTDSATLNTLDEGLQNLPPSRSDSVERARSLISDPQYPSTAILNQVSNLIAGQLSKAE